ncbi:hypothetical protein F4859DRAFT_517746 [Xylaria cf. heliscus]|nr:hypothetical protein F4859DRAFT_517746 [Xylaria cf. heliscus]
MAAAAAAAAAAVALCDGLFLVCLAAGVSDQGRGVVQRGADGLGHRTADSARRDRCEFTAAEASRYSEMDESTPSRFGPGRRMRGSEHDNTGTDTGTGTGTGTQPVTLSRCHAGICTTPIRQQRRGPQRRRQQRTVLAARVMQRLVQLSAHRDSDGHVVGDAEGVRRVARSG